jgi:hypothetical protein
MYTIMHGHHATTCFLRCRNRETVLFGEVIFPFGVLRVNSRVCMLIYPLTLFLSTFDRLSMHLSKESSVSVFGQILSTERCYE